MAGDYPNLRDARDLVARAVAFDHMDLGEARTLASQRTGIPVHELEAAIQRVRLNAEARRAGSVFGESAEQVATPVPSPPLPTPPERSDAAPPKPTVPAVLMRAPEDSKIRIVFDDPRKNVGCNQYAALLNKYELDVLFVLLRKLTLTYKKPADKLRQQSYDSRSIAVASRGDQRTVDAVLFAMGIIEFVDKQPQYSAAFVAKFNELGRGGFAGWAEIEDMRREKAAEGGWHGNDYLRRYGAGTGTDDGVDDADRLADEEETPAQGGGERRPKRRGAAGPRAGRGSPRRAKVPAAG